MLSELEIQNFNNNGFSDPFYISSLEKIDEVVELINSGLISTKAKNPTNISRLRNYSGDVFNAGNMHLTHPVLMDLAMDPAITSRVKCLINEDLCLRRSQLWIKPEGASAVMWHQDTYRNMQLGFINERSAWIALQDCTVDNGCVWLMKGSHKAGVKEVVDTKFRIQFFNSDKLETPHALSHYEQVPMEIKKGQCFLFHQLTFHASGPNKTSSPRIGVAMRYIPSSQEVASDEVMTLVK